MKRFKIVLMVPNVTEVVVADAQAAHNEATRMAAITADGLPPARVHMVEFLNDVVTEEIDFSTVDL